VRPWSFSEEDESNLSGGGQEIVKAQITTRLIAMPFTPALVALAADPATITPARLWQALPREDRIKAILSALTHDEGQRMRGYFVDLLAAKPGGFRAATIRKWSKEEIAGRVAREPLTMVDSLLVDLHFPDRAHIQAAFYDDLGIPHDDGRTEESVAPAAIASEKIPAAADRLIAKYPDDQGLFYLLTIWALDPGLWAGVDEWLRGFAARQA